MAKKSDTTDERQYSGEIPRFRPIAAEELAKKRRHPLEATRADSDGASLNVEKSRRIYEMGFDKALLRQVSPTVTALSVADLEDLAKKFAGLPVKNSNLEVLTVSDLQGLDELFRDQKEQALAEIAGRVGDARLVQQNGGGFESFDISCCCCTPCCCCAATETNPFA